MHTYCTPFAAVRNYLNLDVGKNSTNLLFIVLRLEQKMDFIEPNLGFGKAVLFREALGRNLFTCLFQVIERTYISWLEFSIFSQQWSVFFLTSDNSVFSVLSLIYILKNFCDYIRPIWIIQDNLPIWKCLS